MPRTPRSPTRWPARAPRLRIVLLAASLLLAAGAGAQLDRASAPEGAVAYVVGPPHGAHVTSPVTVRFGLRGMGVAPAGVDRPDAGHHHLLVDVETLPPLDLPLPATDQVRHFGGGQTEVTLELPPGEHTLQLLLGDARHVPHDPPILSERVTITVVEE